MDARKGLKHAFTSEVRDAWVVAYGWLAFTMQRAAARLRADGRAANDRLADRRGPNRGPHRERAVHGKTVRAAA